MARIDQAYVDKGVTANNVAVNGTDLDTILDSNSINLNDERWTVVSNVEELEEALARKDRYIFLRKGPTYNLTGTITPYDGLNLIGECLPSDSANSNNDGVMLKYNGSVIKYIATIEAAGLASLPSRFDGTITLTAAKTVNAGDIVIVDSHAYLIDQSSTGTAVYLRDFIVKDGASTYIDFVKNSLKDFVMKNIQLDDGDTAESIYIYGAVNIRIENVRTVEYSYMLVNLNYAVDAYFDNIEVNYYDYGGFEIVSCSNITIRNNGRIFTGIGTNEIVYSYYLSHFVVENCRGDIRCEDSIYGVIDNCVSPTIISLGGSENVIVKNCIAKSSFYAVYTQDCVLDGCVSYSSSTPFIIFYSDNALVTKCDAPNASTYIDDTGATNQMIFNNRWQRDDLYWDYLNNRIGIGTTSPTSKLHVNGSSAFKVVMVTSATYTAGDETVILADCTSNAITITLPDATTVAGRFYYIKKIDSSSNAITVDAGTQTIDGSPTVTISAQNDSMMIVPYGSNWYIL